MNNASTRKYLTPRDLDGLISRIQVLGYQVYGPVKRDSAIIYEELASVEDLPAGWQDQQEGGHYRLEPTGDQSVFSYVVGPDSWKKYLFPPRETLLRVNKQNGKLLFDPVQSDSKKRAFLGIRPCELHGITVQDRVFAGGEFTDSGYVSKRGNLLLVAVNCSRSAATCFCASMNTGPKAQEYFDLALTEIINRSEHYFLLDTGTDLGAEVIEGLDLRDAGKEHVAAAISVSQQAAEQQRSLNTNSLKEIIYENLNNVAYWADVAERCLNCANCTMVCPTCFCSTVKDVTDLAGDSAERVRYWDSCFNAGHSYIGGGSIRQNGGSRYRQWLMHKLASWQDQFDCLGCVGCGRCITWCPAGIDITAEIDRLHEDANNIAEKKQKGGQA